MDPVSVALHEQYAALCGRDEAKLRRAGLPVVVAPGTRADLPRVQDGGARPESSPPRPADVGATINKSLRDAWAAKYRPFGR